jgi:hypothetical protein
MSFNPNNFIGILIRHQDNKPKRFGQKGFSRREILNFKEHTRQERINNICKRPEYKEFVNWLFSLQRKLGMNDYEFATALGLKSIRPLYRYRNGDGHLPSKRTLKNALDLHDLIDKIQVNNIKVNIKVK